MPIPVWKEATQRYHDPSTQKMVKTKDAEAQISAQKGTKGKSSAGSPSAGSSLGAVAGPIVASLRKEFSGLNKHLAFRFEDIKKAIIGAEKPTRAERLESDDVKPPVPQDIPPEEKEGLLSRLKGMNPFGKDKSPFVKMIAWGAAFLALQLGSDKLAGPDGYLTKFLKWLKETFMPFVTGVWVSIRDYDWGAQWQKVKDVFAKIETFFIEMDENKDGIITWDEFKTKVKGTFQTQFDLMVLEFKEGFWNFVGEYKKEIGLVFAGWVGYKFLKATITSMIFGGAFTLGPRLITSVGLPLVMLSGLWILHQKIRDAYKTAIEDDSGMPQDFNLKEFVANFLSGKDNPDGKTWTASILESWKMGLAGAAVGLTAGLVTGGVFSIPLAAVGFITGSIAGAMGIHLGEDKLNDMLDDAETNIKQTGDDLVTIGNKVINWAKGIYNAAKAIIDPDESISGAYDLATKGEGEQLEAQYDATIRKKKASIANLKRQMAHNIAIYGKEAGTRQNQGMQLIHDRLVAELPELEQRKSESYQTASNVRVQSRSNEMMSLTNQINKLDERIADSNKFGGYGSEMDIARFEEQKAILVSRRDALGRTFTGSMDTFKSTLDASTFEWKSSDKILEARHQADNLALKNEILASQRLEDLNKNFTQPPGQIITDASTKVVNEGDVIHSNLSATPAYSVANMLSASWTNYYGYPDAHR
jgi:hypothetical protein